MTKIWHKCEQIVTKMQLLIVAIVVTCRERSAISKSQRCPILWRLGHCDSGITKRKSPYSHTLTNKSSHISFIVLNCDHYDILETSHWLAMLLGDLKIILLYYYNYFSICKDRIAFKADFLTHYFYSLSKVSLKIISSLGSCNRSLALTMNI